MDAKGNLSSATSHTTEANRTGANSPCSEKLDLEAVDAEKPECMEDNAPSRDTSPSPPPAPSEHTTEAGDSNVVSFGQDDPADPYNWPRPKKLYCAVTCVLMVMNSTGGSSLPSGAVDPLRKYFHITDTSLLVLPVSIYLIGYVLGPMVFAPLSESYGRKPVMISTFVLFTGSVLGCALAPTYASLIVFRLLAGIGASTPVSVIGGIYADLYNTQRARGVAITAFMTATTWGPLGGPIISGFIGVVSWRWVFWVELIIAGVTWVALVPMPETYAPLILRRRAAKLRKETGDPNIIAPSDLDAQSVRDLIVVVLTRPIRMFLFEAIVLSTCLYLSLAYGVFYIFFQAYPIIFRGIYGFSAGEEGLAFIPMGIGSFVACAIYLWWDFYLDKTRRRPNPPAWSQKEEFVRLPLACLGAPLIVVSLFWLGWTARADIHWIVPTMAALPFGIGFLLIFMSLINYVVDGYDVYAASAMGATSASRSIFGVILPFAAAPMYDRLGVAWACTLLGILSLFMGLVPFVFIKYGAQLRANSKLCQELQRQKEEEEDKRRRRWARERRALQRLQDVEKQV